MSRRVGRNLYETVCRQMQTYCILHGYSFLFAALYVFCVNLGGFYEWVVLIFLVLIFILDFLIIGKSVELTQNTINTKYI